MPKMRDRRGDKSDRENESRDVKWSGSSDILGCVPYSESNCATRAVGASNVVEEELDVLRRFCC